MVFMVSDERRSRKPYTLPVLYIPYRGMSISNLRRLTNLMREEMDRLDIEYAGESILDFSLYLDCVS